MSVHSLGKEGDFRLVEFVVCIPSSCHYYVELEVLPWDINVCTHRLKRREDYSLLFSHLSFQPNV